MEFRYISILGEVVLFNIFYEIFTVCTSIVGQDHNGMFAVFLTILSSNFDEGKYQYCLFMPSSSGFNLPKSISLLIDISTHII